MTIERSVIAAVAFTCAAAGAAFAQFVDSGEEKVLSSVADVLMKPVEHRKVVIRGHLVRQLGKEQFLFTDDTGDIRVNIDDELFAGRKVAGDSLIEIQGEVERDFMSTPEIEVQRLIVVAP